MLPGSFSFPATSPHVLFAADPLDSVPCVSDTNIQREDERSGIKALRGMEEKESISSYQRRLGVADFPQGRPVGRGRINGRTLENEVK